jgi:N-acetylmuramoyl-L-alanine amidase
MNFPLRLLALVIVALTCSQCYRVGPPGGGRDRYVPPTKQPVSSGNTPSRPVPGPPQSSSRMLREVNLKVDMVRRGTHGRKVVRPMTPRYITIHSTQNYSADAYKHSLALKNGALRSAKTRYGNRIGYMIWHFTVDDHVAIQHMPTTEQGEHADFHGPGNRLSIGIEMCEQRGCSRSATIERTAKLTAILMKKNCIPLRNVVPHYHWPRRGKHPPNKNCPHFLLDNGRPGAKWRGFLGRVNYYYQRLD